MTDHDIGILFGCWRKDWIGSKTRRSVLQAFDKIPIEKRTMVKKIIAFGCGPMGDILQLENSYSMGCMAAIEKHSMLMDLCEIFKPDVCYVQDPRYYPPWDKTLLQSLGLEVLDEPAGFAEMDESTLVVAVNPEFPLPQIITDLTTPAMVFHKRNTIRSQLGILQEI
jgi:hypothetical protein